MKQGEKINIEELKQGREMNHQELLQFFQAHKGKFWSWGPNKFVKMTDSCLRFTVQGHHHKGHVYIFLNFMDTFDVYLTSNQGTIKHIMNDVYIDEIFGRLDEKIEYIPAYGNK